MRLFKYTSAENALKTLRQLRVKVSVPNQLNDPFELSPKIDLNFYTLERAMQFLRQEHEIERWHAIEARKLGFGSKKAYKRWYLQKANLRKRAEPLFQNLPKNAEDARQNFANTFSSDNGFSLFCASKRRDSILMWSHYAKEHQGIVIEFDTSHPPFSKIQRDFLIEVHYSDEKPTFNLIPKIEQFTKALLNVAKTKSRDWKYEEEVRILFPTKTCIEQQFVSFDPQSVRSITFGCRCKDRATALLELAKPHFLHVGLSEAILSGQEFRLEFKETKR